VFQQLRAAHPDKILGIGSVVDAPTAALFIAHGADFVVGPSFNAVVAQLCNQRKVAYIPGCASVTEIQTAEAHGAEIVKVFPANVYGPGFVKAVRAPMPWTRVMPTGGVGTTEDDVQTWFEAGVSCIGVGSSLSKVDDVAGTCRQLLDWIAKYRQDDGHDL
jgi:2-dehydro-3-deoxyphosphogluconate aldolase/(4S)-4-hydroxy-2-oxoglutarate aldolase